jgi:antirestriction protein ArdC
LTAGVQNIRPKPLSLHNKAPSALPAKGTVPWHKTWKASTGWPRNLITHRQYRGINVLLLLGRMYESPCWLTMRQANMLGGTVRKGEKACPVVFWKRLTVGEKDTTEERQIPLLRYYHVFNLSQCQGLKNGTAPNVAEPELSTKPANIVGNMPQRPLIHDSFTRAFYSLRDDCVGMPARKRFSSDDEYYSTLFHELVHSTGHESRLNRSTLNEQAGYGSDPYCREELIAEIGAAFLCGQAEIAERTIDNSAAYVAEWLTRVKDDRKLIVHAAAQAQRAADFVLGRKWEEGEAAHD